MFYTIQNDNLKVIVSNVGATLVSLIDKSSNSDFVLGFDNQNDYFLNDDPHFGASVGRNANRIAKGRFSIDNDTYQLTINNGPNNLHSGKSDFSFRAFDVEDISDESITFSLEDKDLTGGFPGNLNLKITYKLEDNNLLFMIKGISNKKSILNVTNHSYFNLNNCDSDILNHELRIYSDRVSLNDVDGMATDKVIDVTGTSFDFKEYRNIGNNLNLKHDNLSNGGIDHNYVFEDLTMKKMASLKYGNHEVEVSSNLPALHVYTGNFIYKMTGKYNKQYDQYYGIALECDFYPNGINYDGFIKPIIEANKEVNYLIKWSIKRS